MPRRRRSKTPIDLTLEILPILAGLFFFGWVAFPQFRAAVGLLLYLVLIVGAIALIAIIARLIYRRRTAQTQPAEPATPTAVSVVRQHPIPTSPKSFSPVPTWTLELLRSLEWKRFEELVCAYIRTLGYQARTTRLGADGGVDVEVVDAATNRVAMIVQCKAWNTYAVGIKPVRELFGVMAATKVPQCAFFTSGTYTAEALAFGREHDVDLVDGEELLSRFGQLQLSQSLQLREDATRGDYTTPSCPSCGVKMVLRTSTKGRNAGDGFWGCPSYPRCRQTFHLSQS